MDEVFKKIEKILAEQKQPSRVDFLLPKKVSAAKPSEETIDIAHYGKASAGEPAIISGREGKATESQPADPSAKIGVGSREFKLDELSSEAIGGGANSDVASKIGTGGRMFKLDDLSGEQGSDPLLGNVFQASNSREISLDELSSESEEK